MYAILPQSARECRILAKAQSNAEVVEHLSRWYDTAEEALSEEAAVQLLEKILVVTLH